MTSRRSLLPLILLAAAAGCRGTAPAPKPPVPAPPPGATAQSPTGAPAPAATPTSEPAADPILAVRWVRDAAEYEAAVRQLYAVAQAQVERAVSGRAAGSWAVILDADETIISNLKYQDERTALGKGYSSDSWTAWVKRKEATALPGAAAFLKRVRALGGRIAIVTNRRAAVCGDTEANLKAVGLIYDVVLCRTDEEDKNARFQAVATGTAGQPPLEVVAFVGDNIRDFPALSQAIKGSGPEAFAKFGTTFFVVPNPLYGSWEPRR
jgi:5'-nucleotidase (lipoprotein e(P4) family)